MSRRNTEVDVVRSAEPSLRFEPIDLPPASPARLFVVVDTEEEFDWAAPFSRANVGVRAMDRIGRLQSVFTRFGIVPTYVVDYPVASQPRGFGPLKEFADRGEARIGAHLHPWVNPPFVEELTPSNSFGCRLGAAVEAEKIRVLQAQIEDAFGRRPAVYKAGRYGFGPTTAAALEALGFGVDVSVNPRMDYTEGGGPSFAGFDARPAFFGTGRRLLEIPCTTDYAGVAAAAGPTLHPLISRRAFAPLRLVGIMARLGIVNRVMLSPEGSTLDEMKALTRSLHARGVRTYSLTMHSPSAEPGCTPYVRSEADLSAFVDRIAGYCEFFLGDIGGNPSTPEGFLMELTRGKAS
jgi:hypothetical protein